MHIQHKLKYDIENKMENNMTKIQYKNKREKNRTWNKKTKAKIKR